MTLAAEDVRAFVASGSGLPSGSVIPGNDKGPRVKSAYASVLEVTDMRRAYPDLRQAADGTVTTTQRRTMYSVQWYRAGALDLAREFAAWAENELGLAEAERIGVRVVFPLEVRRLDEIVADSFEERAQLDLSLDWAFTRRLADDMMLDTGIVSTVAVDIEVNAIRVAVEESVGG